MNAVGWILRLLVVVILVAGGFALYRVDAAGQFRTLEPIALPSCTEVPGLVGPEDLTIHRDDAVALVSAVDRRDPEARGGIYAYELKPSRADAPLLVELTKDFEGDFRPHGLSLRRSPIDGDSVFVVNHPDGEAGPHTVEIFDWRSRRLTHRKTVTDPLLISPNDVLAVDGERFYATNDHGRGPGFSRKFGDLVGRRDSNVVYWDGESMRVVAEGLGYANGINMSKDGKIVWVAATTEGAIHIYDRDPETGDLSPWHVEVLGTGVDNIELDLHGSLWIGAHPKLLSFLGHAGDADKTSPSEVLWYDPDRRLDPYVRPVYLDLGEELSGISVAAPFGSRVLMGSVFEPFLLVCERG
ncbi:MAG: SMP-30/gluconolactonase/LRE family protein [Acidobacteriota bacterium]